MFLVYLHNGKRTTLLGRFKNRIDAEKCRDAKNAAIKFGLVSNMYASIVEAV